MAAYSHNMEMPVSKSSTMLSATKPGVGAPSRLLGSAMKSRASTAVSMVPRMIQTTPASSPQPRTRGQLILLLGDIVTIDVDISTSSSASFILKNGLQSGLFVGDLRGM